MPPSCIVVSENGGTSLVGVERCNEDSVVMEILPHTFVILQIIGVWRPEHWSPGWKTRLYNFYTCLVAIFVLTVTLSETIELMKSFGDLAALVSNSFLLLTLIADFGKGANILKKRGEIIALTNILQNDPCRPITDEEVAIQRKFDRLIRSNTLCYATLLGVTVSVFILKSVLDDIPQRTLLNNAWVPFEHHDSMFRYSMVYIPQVLTVVVGGTICTAFDTMLPGLMLQTCAQLTILKCRLNRMTQIVRAENGEFHRGVEMNLLAANLESKLLGQFAEKSNELFGLMVLAQYTISTLVLCVSVLDLSRMKLFTSEFTALIIYIITIATQIFIYCYYGGEVAFQSLAVADSVYDTDWASLTINTKRSLLTVMVRSLRPIEFTSGQILTLNLDYFNKLLKLSYSVYNVLQQSSE